MSKSFCLVILGVFQIFARVSGSILVGKFETAPVVTLYGSQQALVEKIVSSAFPDSAGHFRLLVKGVRSTIKPESIRLRGPKGIDILDVNLFTSKNNTDGFVANETEIAMFIDQISLLKAVKAKIETTKKSVETERSSALSAVSRILGNVSDMTVGKLQEWLTYQSGYLAESDRKLLNLSDQINEISLNISAIEKEIQSIRDKVKKQIVDGSVARIDLSFGLHVHNEFRESFDTLNFLLSYLVDAASWSPEYDFHVENKNTEKCASSPLAPYTLRIDYYANVRQATGEDWLDAELTLSSSNPSFLDVHPEPVQRSIAHLSFTIPPPTKKRQVGRSADLSANRLSGTLEHLSTILPTVAPSSSPTCGPRFGPTFEPTAASQPTFGPTISMSMYDKAEFSHDTAVQSDVTAAPAMGASYQFRIPYPVNITSSFRDPASKPLPGETTVTPLKQMVLIDKMTLDVQLFSYAVPSQDSEVYFMAWGKYALRADSNDTSKVLSSLLPSSEVRVNLHSDHIGYTRFDGMEPGQRLKVNLGYDKHLKMFSTSVAPVYNGKREDKSSWFTVDKKHYRVRNEERMTTLQNTHTANSTLVIVAENLPRSTLEDTIRVDLLEPSLKSVHNITAADNNNDECLAYILEHFAKEAAPSNRTIFYSHSLRNLYWAQWLAPRSSATVVYKYNMLQLVDERQHV